MITPGVRKQIEDQMDERTEASVVRQESEPTNQMQMEAQARVFIARLVRAAEAAVEPSLYTGQRRSPIDADTAKREMTVQVRRARKLAQDEAALYIARCLDYGTPLLPNTISPDLLRALERVLVLAKMLRGPNSESD